MQIEEGKLIPGVAIGEYYIGMKKEDLIKKLGDDYIDQRLGSGNRKIILENAMIWIDPDGLVNQIGVTKGFQGNYQDKIRIGTTLYEIKEMYDGYEERYDTYNLIDVDGMCFELIDDDDDISDDDWAEGKVPIEWIFVYRMPDKLAASMQEIQGKIIPGVAIGEYYIGMGKKELEKKLGVVYINRCWKNGKYEIIIGNAKIGFDENDHINKIGVTKGFQNDYQGKIRIGTTLNEIKEMYGDYEGEYGIYQLAGVDGLCFSLGDLGKFEYLDESDILRSPIEWIYVYRISDR